MNPQWSPVEREEFRREVAARLATVLVGQPVTPRPGEDADATSTRTARVICKNAVTIAEGLCLALEGKL